MAATWPNRPILELSWILFRTLFAAVAAHYQAVPQAPRVILLDEVFVGVNIVNRGRSSPCSRRSALDLDLDVLLTSDHE